ncbi:MAG: hypothetical protein M3220_20010 [Chloroflexota bacterium]|nr:hypothetical protein [Chloroflexota bacterium]
MASRLMSDTILTLRPRRPTIPAMSMVSRAAARGVLVILTVLGMLLFLYLAEVSQGTTTAFDIDLMKVKYHQLQEQNQELERQIAELESPEHVLRYAEAQGMTARTEAEYVLIKPAPETGQ